MTSDQLQAMTELAVATNAAYDEWMGVLVSGAAQSESESLSAIDDYLSSLGFESSGAQSLAHAELARYADEAGISISGLEDTLGFAWYDWYKEQDYSFDRYTESTQEAIAKQLRNFIVDMELLQNRPVDDVLKVIYNYSMEGWSWDRETESEGQGFLSNLFGELDELFKPVVEGLGMIFTTILHAFAGWIWDKGEEKLYDLMAGGEK